MYIFLLKIGNPYFYGGFVTLSGSTCIALSLTLRINKIYETMERLVDMVEDQALEQTNLRDILRLETFYII